MISHKLFYLMNVYMYNINKKGCMYTGDQVIIDSSVVC